MSNDTPQVENGIVDPTGKAPETDEERESQQPAVLLGEGAADVEASGPDDEDEDATQDDDQAQPGTSGYPPAYNG